MREGVVRGSALLLVLFAFCLPLFVGLGNTDLGNDEAIYSYAVDSILATGEWMSPRSSPNDDIVFLEKPSLKFWIVAAPIRAGLLPHNEFGLRFWDAVFGAGAFIYTFLIGRRIAGVVCGVIAVLVLFVHEPLLFEHGLRSNNMEAALLLAYCGGVHHFIRWVERPGRGIADVAAVTTYFFLGFMTKFVAALFLPVVLGVSAVLLPGWRSRLMAGWRIWGLAVVFCAMATLPWFVYQYAHHGPRLWLVMFAEHVYTRFTAYVDPTHLRPWHFYVSEMVLQLQRAHAAWLAAIGGVLLVADTVRRPKPGIVLVVLWAVVPTLLISLGTSKVYHYYYPFLPPVALAAGYGAARLWEPIAGLASLVSARLTGPGDAWAVPRSVWLVAAALLAVSLAVAAATVIWGSVRLGTGDVVWFRNTSSTRPLSLSLICLVVVARFRGLAIALIAVIALAVPSPLSRYTRTLSHLAETRRPLHLLADCIERVDHHRRLAGETPSGVYAAVAQRWFTHPPFYYLRGEDWLTPAFHEPTLAAALFGPDPRPVAIDPGQFRDFLARMPAHPPPAGLQFDQTVVALPGPYEKCVALAPRNR